jgi:hypothetical protein
MTEFESLSDADQAAIMARTLNRLTASKCRTIDELASREQITVTELWANLCREAHAPESTIPARLRP